MAHVTNGLPVRPHPTYPELMVIYYQDGTRAGYARMVIPPRTPEIGAYAPVMLEIVDNPDKPPEDDDLSRPARFA